MMASLSVTYQYKRERESPYGWTEGMGKAAEWSRAQALIAAAALVSQAGADPGVS